MKRLVSSLLPLLLAINAVGQIGHEWIQYAQPYLKISVAQDGIYRVSFQALQQAGFTNGDPRKLQLFHRGKEQAIYVEGESDGALGSGDFIEFYGRRNDGTLDSTLYLIPAQQPHRYYNLFSDTTAYFLTAGSSNGKRMVTYSASSGGLVARSFHWAEKLLILRESYSGGIDYGDAQKSSFDAGEGWMGAQVLHGQEVTYKLEGITATSPASGRPMLEVLMTGRGPMLHNVELFVGGRLLSTISFSGYASYKYAGQIEWSDIDVSGILTVRMRVTGGGGADRVSAGYLRLTFPQATTMSGVSDKLFSLNAASDPALLSIQSAPAGARVFDVTSPSAPVRISTQLSGTLNAVVPGASAARKIFATSAWISPASIKRVTFRAINPAQHDYVIITHPSLRRAALGYVDPVKAYAEYRSLPEGGGYDTLIVNIGQLYDQFNYGETSPRAIYQFMRFCASVQLPDFLFLVGKGLDVNYGYHRNPGAFPVYKDLVPTAGYPASDMAFSEGLGGVEHNTAVATGRLTANTPAEVAAYLNKVREHDAMPYDDLRRKRMLHLSGGIEESEPLFFKQILENLALIAEGLYLGGQVKAIAKQSTDIKLVNIAEEVNRGVGMITFFGHSAPNTLDFDIGLASDPIMGYDNAKKYPFMLMNGCDAGSFFLNTEIIGENWVKTPGKGAIGFVAHSSYGLLASLQLYGVTFYQVAFGDPAFINKGIGVIQREVVRRFLRDYGTSAANISQAQQMMLLGDPAVAIFGAPKPDYAPIRDGIVISSFNDEPVTAFSDSFQIAVPVRNYGIARSEQLRVNVRREYGEGQLIEYDTIVPSTLFEDTLRLTLRNTNARGFGINVFTIHVDADDLIDELSESNNTAAFEFFIPLNSTRNLFPYNYSIVSDRELQLSFQFTDLLSGPRDFVLEIDTSSHFDSQFLKTFQLTAQVLARQPVLLAERDSTVYFWRTRIADPLGNESADWTTSSFTFIDDGPEGWAQMRFDQYAGNASTGLVADPELRRMEFQETVSDIAIRTFSALAAKPMDSTSFKVNGVELNLLYEGGACRNNTINLIAFDRRSTRPYAGLYFTWYELLYEYGGRRLLCGREPYVINSFTPGELVTGNQDDLIQYVDNIPEGDTVVLFNFGNAGYAQWPAAAKTKLGEIGISAAQLDGLQNGDAVVIFGRKGAPAGAAQVYSTSSQEPPLKVERTIAGRFMKGSFSSGIIGPAQRWDRLIPQVKELEAVDQFTFTVIGIASDGSEDTLRANIQSSQDLSFIDAAAYPHIKVVFETGDNINVTAAQLSKWLVLYEPVAEGLVFYNGSASQRVAREGESVAENFGFVNVSNKIFPDSLLVRLDMMGHGSVPATAEFRISPPLPNDTTVFSVALETIGRVGINDVQVYVNPRIVPEKTFNNNLVFLPDYLDVRADRASPVLEVTVDGRHLRDDDFVSSNPSIHVRLWDENPFMLKKDTLGLRIFLAYPCATEECPFEPIYFTRDDVKWYAATDTSDFTATFTPANLVTGRYRLRVEARDASGNTAGEQPYEIRFRVDREESIDVTTAYPNPFYLETGVDVVVTGEQEMPISYKLSIATVSGSVVRELSNETVGLHVGINRITWDGSAADGHALPDGIYFYRLTLVRGGTASVYNGKLVLLR